MDEALHGAMCITVKQLLDETHGTVISRGQVGIHRLSLSTPRKRGEGTLVITTYVPWTSVDGQTIYLFQILVKLSTRI